MVNKEEVSARINERVGQLKYFRENLHGESGPGQFLIDGVLPGVENTILLTGNIEGRSQISPHKLQFTMVDESLNMQVIAIIDYVLEFLVRRPRDMFMKVPWRELENFLRDSNTKPSMPTGFCFGENDFLAIQRALCLALYMGIGARYEVGEISPPPKGQHFTKMSYIGQIKAIQRIFKGKIEHIFSFFEEKIDFYSYQSETSEIEIRISGSKNRTDFFVEEDFVKILLAEELHVNSIKVVAYKGRKS